MPPRRVPFDRIHPRRRVLLVAPTPLMLSAVEPILAEVADVRSVSFPGDSFDRAVEEGDDDVVIVDLTYLDESLVRPLITRRFADGRAVVVFVVDAGPTRIDDLVTLAAGNSLRLVQPR